MTLVLDLVPSLKQCALQAAARSGHYKRQHSLMEALPGHLVDALFVEVAKIRRQGGDKSASVALDGFNASLRRFKMDAGMADRIDDWLALLGTFRKLVGVEIRGFHHINDDHIMHLSKLVNQLEVLRLRDCTVGCATLQKYIALCTNLKDLDLSGTHVAATQSFSPIANLNRLKNLHTLQLEGLQLYDMHFLPLKNLPSITNLNIALNFISNEGALCLTSLQKLEILDISRTSVTIVPPLPSLRVLRMNSCNVGMVNEVGGKDGLVSKALEVLEFNYSEFKEQLGWCFVAELVRDSAPSLRTVDFSDSTLSEFSFLQEGTNLHLIDLSGTYVMDTDLLEISMLKNLSDLRLMNTFITNKGIENLRPLSKHLQSLSLRDCRHIDSWVFPSLAHLKSLTFLNLGGTNVDRIQLAPKKNMLSPAGYNVDVRLPKLTSLGLLGTQWTDEGSGQLQHFCPNLTELRMGSKSERVTDESLKKLHLPFLTKLVFEVPILTDSGLKKIYWLKKSLRTVELIVREGLSAHALQWLYTEIGLQRVTRNGHLVRRDSKT